MGGGVPRLQPMSSQDPPLHKGVLLRGGSAISIRAEATAAFTRAVENIRQAVPLKRPVLPAAAPYRPALALAPVRSPTPRSDSPAPAAACGLAVNKPVNTCCAA